jgi:hypothetical protein
MGLFGNKKEDQQPSDLNAIGSDGEFDSGEVSLDVISEVSSSENNSDFSNSGFNVGDSSGVPPLDSDVLPTETKKNSKLLPLAIGGGALLVVVFIIIAMMMGGNSSNKEEQNVAKEDTTEMSVPTLDDKDTLPASSVQSEKESKEVVVSEGNASEVSKKPEQVLSASATSAPVTENKNDAAVQKDTSTQTQQASSVKTPETQVSNKNEQKQVTENKVDTANGINPMDNNVSTADVETPIKKSIVNEQNSTNISSENQNTNKDKAAQLKEEAQRLLNEAAALEKGNDLDMMLAGKSLEEQVEYLKQRVIISENELTKVKHQANACVRPSMYGKKKHNSRVKSSFAGNLKAKKIAGVTGLMYDKVWIKDKSYLVGDKLPNGALIKDIDYDSRIIKTNKGNFRG